METNRAVEPTVSDGITYTSRDLWLTASLISLGMELIRVEGRRRRPNENPGPAWALFVLKDHPLRSEWNQQYLAGTLMVPVVKLRSTIGFLRSEMQRANASPGSERGEA